MIGGADLQLHTQAPVKEHQVSHESQQVGGQRRAAPQPIAELLQQSCGDITWSTGDVSPDTNTGNEINHRRREPTIQVAQDDELLNDVVVLLGLCQHLLWMRKAGPLNRNQLQGDRAVGHQLQTRSSPLILWPGAPQTPSLVTS